MKALILHHTDSDGFVSALLVHHFLTKEYKDIEISFVPITYGDKEDLDMYKSFDKVFVVDYSLSKDTTNELYKALSDNFVWIDHHISAITRLSEENSFVEGLRSTAASGCLLTFRYFEGHKATPPLIVDLINKWDLHLVDQDFETLVIPANLIFIKYAQSVDQILPLNLLTNEGAGRAIESLGRIFYAEYQKKLSVESNRVFFVDSKNQGMRIAVLNTGERESAAIERALRDREETVDLMCAFNIISVEGVESVRASIYRSQSNTNEEFSCAEIAEKYTGGGHKDVAGFTIPVERFFKEFLS